MSWKVDWVVVVLRACSADHLSPNSISSALVMHLTLQLQNLRLVQWEHPMHSLSSAVSLQRLSLSHDAAPVVDLVVIFAGVGIMVATRLGRMALSYQVDVTVMG